MKFLIPTLFFHQDMSSSEEIKQVVFSPDSSTVCIVPNTSKSPKIKVHDLDSLEFKISKELQERRKEQFQQLKELEENGGKPDDDGDDEDDQESGGDAFNADTEEEILGDSQIYLSPDDPNMAISINTKDSKLFVLDTSRHVITKSFTIGFEPRSVLFIDTARVVLLNPKQNCFVLLDIEEGKTQWKSTEKFLSRHMKSPKTSVLTYVKKTNEFAALDHQKNLKVFSLETGILDWTF
jgi:hypothetical protein